MKFNYILIIMLVVLDQWTKKIIIEKFQLYESITVIDGFFNLTYVLNPGAAFGFLAKMDERFRVLFFVFVTFIAICLVVYLIIRERGFILRRYAYSFILAGAIGNLIDRVMIGKVVDFLDFYIKSYHWPAFNVADVSISCGVGLLLLDLIRDKKRKQATGG
ncbi:MAG: signal peptidase II [Calditerrivibrio sp.]|nr:signal peptidase II [Calditerrivibrio sp.]